MTTKTMLMKEGRLRKNDNFRYILEGEREKEGESSIKGEGEVQVAPF